MTRKTDATSKRRELNIPADAFVVVIGSTRSEEEERLVIEAIAEVGIESLHVIHAPRHLERVPALKAAVEALFQTVSLRSTPPYDARYMILDTYGELSQIYAVADVVIIGGGFANHGGQNLLQPLAHGKPVLHGPHMQNFGDVARASLAAGASIECATALKLAEQIKELQTNPEKRKLMGEAAANFISQNQGAAKRYAQAIAEHLVS